MNSGRLDVEIEDAVSDNATSSLAGPVAQPRQCETVIAHLQLRRFAQNGNINDESIGDFIGEANCTDSEPDVGLVHSSDLESDAGPSGPRATGGEYSDDDNFEDADDEFEGFTFHCDPLASRTT